MGCKLKFEKRLLEGLLPRSGILICLHISASIFSVIPASFSCLSIWSWLLQGLPESFLSQEIFSDLSQVPLLSLVFLSLLKWPICQLAGRYVCMCLELCLGLYWNQKDRRHIQGPGAELEWSSARHREQRAWKESVREKEGVGGGQGEWEPGRIKSLKAGEGQENRFPKQRGAGL